MLLSSKNGIINLLEWFSLSGGLKMISNGLLGGTALMVGSGQKVCTYSRSGRQLAC